MDNEDAVNDNKNEGNVKIWAGLFHDNQKPSAAMPLLHLERAKGRLKLDFEDIDTMEDALGFCLVDASWDVTRGT